MKGQTFINTKKNTPLDRAYRIGYAQGMKDERLKNADDDLVFIYAQLSQTLAIKYQWDTDKIGNLLNETLERWQAFLEETKEMQTKERKLYLQKQTLELTGLDLYSTGMQPIMGGEDE